MDFCLPPGGLPLCLFVGVSEPRGRGLMSVQWALKPHGPRAGHLAARGSLPEECGGAAWGIGKVAFCCHFGGMVSALSAWRSVCTLHSEIWVLSCCFLELDSQRLASGVGRLGARTGVDIFYFCLESDLCVCSLTLSKVKTGRTALKYFLLGKSN